jgi:V8-like Glu-specific endopeptidase
MRAISTLIMSIITASALGGCAIEGPGPDEGGTPPDTSEGPVTERPEDAVAEPIIGGSEAYAYPEAVIVNMSQNGWQSSVCSGSVIAPTLVLTAGHCVAGYDGWQIVAPYAGSGQTATAVQAFTYDWNDNGNTVNPNQHDIGVIVLGSPITIDDYPVVASSMVANGTQVANIGRVSNGQMNYDKLFLGPMVTVYDATSYGFPLDYRASAIIQPGDSGGPVVLQGGAPRTIVAVNSGVGGNTQVLARVDLLHGWLQDQIATHGGFPSDPQDDPPQDPPDDPPGPTCEHPICSEGPTLTASCDPCASAICDIDPYCCQTWWDGICVAEVNSVCGQTCN